MCLYSDDRRNECGVVKVNVLNDCVEYVHACTHVEMICCGCRLHMSAQPRKRLTTACDRADNLQ